MSLISRLLDKLNIKNENDLSPDEKATINRYKMILSDEAITVESIKSFMRDKIAVIENRFASGETTEREDNFLKASLHVYLNLLKLIEAPEAEKKALEDHLNQLISEPIN